ncbi:MAG: hypothetical protein K9M10_03250 [Candidatus Pacebacteria bacterium]|nr:hypothetical protein [Candidatus Paceibacterota bacterium]MCF7857471.1 hypothetical protein [Candidatus Paceibacterota bacterium]
MKKILILGAVLSIGMAAQFALASGPGSGSSIAMSPESADDKGLLQTSIQRTFCAAEYNYAFKGRLGMGSSDVGHLNIIPAQSEGSGVLERSVPGMASCVSSFSLSNIHGALKNTKFDDGAGKKMAISGKSPTWGQLGKTVGTFAYLPASIFVKT